MRAPSLTFRDALKAHRRWLTTLEPRWKRQIATDLVTRWIDHGECEAVWSTICSHLKVQVTADHFIAEIISTRLAAEPLQTPSADFKARMHALTNRLSYEGKYQELADRNQDFGDAIAKFEKARNHAEDSGLLSRKTPARMYFMRQLSSGFSRWCGQPLDNVVRALTDIAFDAEISTEAVRAAHNPRPKRDRGIRPPK